MSITKIASLIFLNYLNLLISIINAFSNDFQDNKEFIRLDIIKIQIGYIFTIYFSEKLFNSLNQRASVFF